MNIKNGKPAGGIAMIIVMLVIFVLGVMAGGFAYTMKVEMKLAKNHNHETELEWLGRSGVELARYILAQEMVAPNQPFDALNQKWAGGLSSTNEAIADIPMDNYQLGDGSFSLKIIDMERKININTADPVILRRAMDVIGVDSTDASAIVDSIQDWRDPDERKLMNGAESDFYRATPNEGFVPHYSKNAPFDDIRELLMVRGVTPLIFWGPGGDGMEMKTAEQNSRRIFSSSGQSPQHVGLVDLFNVLGRQLNVNTASAIALQGIPPIDENVAQAIIQLRAGPDGVDGTEDDTPLRNPGDLVNVSGIGRGLAPQILRYFTVRSTTFEVHVDARIENYHREYVAVLRRNNPRDIQVFSFYWK